MLDAGLARLVDHILDDGRSTTVSISFGIALVAGRKRVPSPATGNTALRTRAAHCGSSLRLKRQAEAVTIRPGSEVLNLFPIASGNCQ